MDDACDVCPHVADDGADRDGDQVGDACDPNPDDPREHVAFFDPFTAQRPEWDLMTPGTVTYSYLGDSALFDARTGQIRSDLLLDAPTDDLYAIGMRLGAGRTAGQRQIAMYALQDDTHLYYCDLGTFMGMHEWQETYTRDGTNYVEIVGGAATGPLENGELVMTMRVTPGSPVQFQCTTTWPVAQPVLVADAPAGIVPTRASFSLIGVQAEVRWFVQISSDP